MLFNNLITYRLTGDINITHAALAKKAFVEAAEMEASRYGWTTPNSALEDLVHEQAGALLICTQHQEKILPSAVIKREAQKMVDEIQKKEQRKVDRKELQQIKDDVCVRLLPRAFSRYKKTYALIVPSENLIFVNTSSFKTAETLLSYLRTTLGSLPCCLPDVKHSPSAIMSNWIENRQADDFRVLDQALLRDNLVKGAAVNVKGQELVDNDEYTTLLENGKTVSSLLVEYHDTLRFMLHECLRLTGLKLSGEADKARAEELDDDSDAIVQLNSDMALQALLFPKLFNALANELGGLVEPEQVI